MSKFKHGDRVLVKGNDYGSFWFLELLPKGAGGRTCKLAKVVHSSSVDECFDDVVCGMIKTIRLIDLRPFK